MERWVSHVDPRPRCIRKVSELKLCHFVDRSPRASQRQRLLNNLLHPLESGLDRLNLVAVTLLLEKFEAAARDSQWILEIVGHNFSEFDQPVSFLLDSVLAAIESHGPKRAVDLARASNMPIATPTPPPRLPAHLTQATKYMALKLGIVAEIPRIIMVNPSAPTNPHAPIRAYRSRSMSALASQEPP